MSDPRAAKVRAPYRRTKVFISYRRDGSAGDAERLHDELKRYFFGRHLFLDVKSIGTGDGFPLAIETALDNCGALLAVIGPRWLNAAGERGPRRLEDPSDLVRREISAALAKGKWVVPVLMHGAEMPEAKELPEDLRRLAECQAVEIRSGYWERDVKELVALLKRRLNRRKRLATVVSCAAVLAVAAALSLYFAKAPVPVPLTADGEVKIPKVMNRFVEQKAQQSELVIEGLADADEVFWFDGKPIAQVRLTLDVARFQERTIEGLGIKSDWGKSWAKAIYSVGRDKNYVKVPVDYTKACTTSVQVAAPEGSAPPTTLRIFHDEPPGGEDSRAVSLSADGELAVNVDLTSVGDSSNGAGCTQQLEFAGDKEPTNFTAQSPHYLVQAGAASHLQFGSLDPTRISKRGDDELLRFGEDYVRVVPLKMRARCVAVRALGDEENPCDDSHGRAPANIFSARSADDKSSLNLEKLEIGDDYFRLVAEAKAAYVANEGQFASPPFMERLNYYIVPAVLLLASACLALFGLVYSFIRL